MLWLKSPTIKKNCDFSANAEPYRVAYKDILYLESQQRIVVLHTENPLQGGDRFYGKLEDLENELEPDGFLRIQKSYLVNMAHIKKLNYDKVSSKQWRGTARQSKALRTD